MPDTMIDPAVRERWRDTAAYITRGYCTRCKRDRDDHGQPLHVAALRGTRQTNCLPCFAQLDEEALDRLAADVIPISTEARLAEADRERRARIDADLDERWMSRNAGSNTRRGR